MASQIANSMITDKVDRVARATGLSVPAVVELALDLWLTEMSEITGQTEHMAARMALLDSTPYRNRPSESIQ